MKQRRKRLLIFPAILIAYMLFLLLPRLVCPYCLGGNFGLRPRTSICVGLTLSPRWVEKIFPRGIWQLNLLGKGYEYRVVGQEDYGYDYCLGQDIWVGE